ncbi:N-acetyl sugar amidotransferase [Candidatus Pelagibacter sp.]|nr:N-acetyl sugar amidotransferase [Candidatus Pelagibacter sp.]
MNKICKNCVLDTTISKIKFDSDGICNYCQNFKRKNIDKILKNNENKFLNLVKKIKNKNNKYDCLIGISGGTDSSYLVHLIKDRYKLNPLLLHVDAGWNSNISTNNIGRIVEKLDCDLVTKVVNWEEMRDLQLAYMKAQVPNLDAIQDHVFFAEIYNYAYKNNIKYIFTGANYSTEFIREPLEWAYHASDLKQIKDIHKKFGTISIKNLPQCDIFKQKIIYRLLKRIKVVSPLNYINYNKNDAEKTLIKNYKWMPYAEKHHESRFTAFFEGFWSYEKFGFDKRKIHFSNLILSNQMARDEALLKLNKKPYDKDFIQNDIKFICDKLNISKENLNELFNGKNKNYYNYKSNYFLIKLFTKLLMLLHIEKRLII